MPIFRRDHRRFTAIKIGEAEFMKTKITEMSYSDVLNLEKEKHQNPIRPNIFFRTLLKLVGIPDLLKSHFTCRYEGMRS